MRCQSLFKCYRMTAAIDGLHEPNGAPPQANRRGAAAARALSLIRESDSIDSIFPQRSMPKPRSLELRERVVEALKSGASRRGQQIASTWPLFGYQTDAAAAGNRKHRAPAER